MQIPCTVIAEIKPWTFCVLRGSESIKNRRFLQIPMSGKIKKIRDSALIGTKYANPMHRHCRNRTQNLLRFRGSDSSIVWFLVSLCMEFAYFQLINKQSLNFFLSATRNFEILRFFRFGILNTQKVNDLISGYTWAWNLHIFS